MTRGVLYAGWMIGGLGLVLSSSSDRPAGAAAVGGGLLILVAALTDIAGELRFRGNRSLLNGVLAFIALCWLAFGASLLV